MIWTILAQNRSPFNFVNFCFDPLFGVPFGPYLGAINGLPFGGESLRYVVWRICIPSTGWSQRGYQIGGLNGTLNRTQNGVISVIISVMTCFGSWYGPYLGPIWTLLWSGNEHNIRVYICMIYYTYVYIMDASPYITRRRPCVQHDTTPVGTLQKRVQMGVPIMTPI